MKDYILLMMKDYILLTKNLAQAVDALETTLPCNRNYYERSQKVKELKRLVIKAIPEWELSKKGE